MHAPTLLIVEDEERMRRLFELVLKPAGYQLLLARSGDEALRVIQEHESLDMIITDLQLGAVSGMDVLEAARQQVPDVPVLIVTGYGTVKSAVEAVATGSESTWDAGNVNATVIGDTHYLSFYSGKAPDTSVLVSALPAPKTAPKAKK